MYVRCKRKSMGFKSDSLAGRARTKVKEGTHSQGLTGSKPESEGFLKFYILGTLLALPCSWLYLQGSKPG